MARSRWAARTDSNHTSVMAYFRAHGITVKDTSRLPGFVDLVCGFVTGRVALVEVKAGKGQLTPAQETFRRDFPMIYIVRNDADADGVIRWLKNQ